MVVACAVPPIACGGGSESSETTAMQTAPTADPTSSGDSVTGRPAETPESRLAPTEQDAPQADTAPSSGYDPTKAAGAIQGKPAPTNTSQIVAVANYFAELPGIDTSSLKDGQKEKFLHRINSELCTCGCKDDTLARCYVNDPKCPIAKSLVLEVIEEVKSAR